MLEFLSKYLYLVLIIIAFFMMLYFLGGEDIVYFRKKKYNYDIKGEEKLIKALNRFAKIRSFTVLGKTTIAYGEKEYTFDGILLCYFGTIAFSVDGHGGEIYGSDGEEKWTQIFEEKKSKIQNPVSAMNGAERLFREIYRTEKAKFGQIETMVVYTNDYCSVAVPKSLPVCHVRDLVKKLESKKYLADNGADIDAMKAAIEKYSK